MSMPKISSLKIASLNAVAISVISATALLLPSVPCVAQTAPRLGTVISPEDLAKWDRNVFPNGRGLPRGKGTAIQGKAIFNAKCASCHGPGGRGYTADELAGSSEPLSSSEPSKTVGTYWPYATTLFDFTRRSMPMGAPGSLSVDEVYAVTAYILSANNIISDNKEMNEQSLPLVMMPNRDGFDRIDAK